MKTKIPFIAPSFIAAVLAPALHGKGPAEAPPPADPPREKIQIALLLDTSNSMDGLIDQARTQLWKVVNTFTEAKRGGQTPFVEVALYEYGNNGLHIGNHWIRQVEPLTRDLDEISKELFAFRTYGGDEYCGAVIQRALADLSWDPSPGTYKAVFIAGNEPFTQGPVDARQACRDAMAKGIVVNTIHCGSRDAGIAGQWHDGAALAEGKFLVIDQDKAVVHIDAPQDKEITTLGEKLNKTYLGYGANWREGAAKQMAADRDAAANAAKGAAVGRAFTKANASYCNTSWDLIDACREGKVKLPELPADQLPEAMRAMDPAEREEYVAKMAAERATLQKKIVELTRQREAFVAAERAKQAAESDASTLDQAIADTVRNQAAARGYSFGK